MSEWEDKMRRQRTRSALLNASMGRVIFICQECAAPFVKVDESLRPRRKRDDTVYCSGACKQKAYRKRVKGA
jgi:hypothetical protein